MRSLSCIVYAIILCTNCDNQTTTIYAAPSNMTCEMETADGTLWPTTRGNQFSMNIVEQDGCTILLSRYCSQQGDWNRAVEEFISCVCQTNDKCYII